jgi:hypothetical protein
MTTLADDLLLVLLDPVSGKPRTTGTRLDYGLAGALLLELALAMRIDIVGAKPSKADVVVLDDAPLEDDVLADALRRMGEKRRRADQLVPRLARGLRGRLLERAEHRGRRPPAAARAASRPVARGGRHATARAGDAPGRRAADRRHSGPADGGARRAARRDRRGARRGRSAGPGDAQAVSRRARQIGEGAWAAESVRRAVKAASNAVAASTAAAVAAATVASS